MDKRILRIALIVALLLVVPLVFTLLGSGVDGDGWHWTFFDFVVAFILLFGAGLTYELVSRKMKNGNQKIAAGLAVLTALGLMWVNAAVGIIGNDNGSNLLYFAALIVGLISAIVVRFNPRKLASVSFIVAGLIFLVPIIALLIWNSYMDPWVREFPEVFVLNSVFVVLYVISGFLFRRASKK